MLRIGCSCIESRSTTGFICLVTNTSGRCRGHPGTQWKDTLVKDKQLRQYPVPVSSEETHLWKLNKSDTCAFKTTFAFHENLIWTKYHLTNNKYLLPSFQYWHFLHYFRFIPLWSIIAWDFAFCSNSVGFCTSLPAECQCSTQKKAKIKKERSCRGDFRLPFKRHNLNPAEWSWALESIWGRAAEKERQ